MIANPSRSLGRIARGGPNLAPHEYAAQAVAVELGLYLRFEGPTDDRTWRIFARGGVPLGSYSYRKRRFSIGDRRGTALSGWRPVLEYAAGRSKNPLAPQLLRPRP